MIRYFLSVMIVFAILYANIAKAADDPDSLYKQGNFAQAQKAYTEADMNHSKDIRFRYNRGCAAYQNSDFKAATAAFSSVLKRTDDKEIRFKALYNLGNTAFKQKKFESAASYYKQAIVCNPENEDAGYNLELSLRELDRQKKKEKDQKNESQQDSQKKEDKPGKPGENKKDDKKNQKGSDKQSSDNKEDKSNKDESGKRDESGKNKEKENDQGKSDKRKGSENNSNGISGQPNPSQLMPEQEENMAPETKSMLDKKKADALLDSIRENRSIKAFGNLNENTRLGKDW